MNNLVTSATAASTGMAATTWKATFADKIIVITILVLQNEFVIIYHFGPRLRLQGECVKISEFMIQDSRIKNEPFSFMQNEAGFECHEL